MHRPTVGADIQVPACTLAANALQRSRFKIQPPLPEVNECACAKETFISVKLPLRWWASAGAPAAHR
jgi:hypothetical protein